ncbi:MAG: hypothetical protein KGS72_00630 [Cyanobacteria bacterium REEB67]|nr:hypothetical protein [Cyanobacteria bacterium REEB67]
MTRFSDNGDYVDPRSLAAQSAQNDGFSINSTYGGNNQQSQFADYIMPVSANAANNRSLDGGYVDPRYMTGANYDSGAAYVDPRYTSATRYDGNYVDPRYAGAISVRNDQMALSMALPFSTGLQNGAAYGWQQNPGEGFRERRFEHMREQQIQGELYYDATTPRYGAYQDPRYQGYSDSPGYDQGWQNPLPIYRPMPQPIYRQPVYEPNYDSSYDPAYSRYDRGQTERVYVAPPPQRYIERSAPQPQRDDDCDRDQRPVLRSSGSSPDLTESSFANGSQYPLGDRSDLSEKCDKADTQTFRQDGNSGSWSPYDRAVYDNLNQQAQALVGHNIQEFDPSVPIRLGCARAVSLLVEKGYGFPIKDQAIVNVEKDLRKMGFTQVSINDMKPGDVICGYREAGDYPHGAVYMGNGKIFNNDSDDGIMEIQSIAKYNKAEFKHFVILRRPATVPAVAADSAPSSRVGRSGANQDGQVDG